MHAFQDPTNPKSARHLRDANDVHRANGMWSAGVADDEPPHAHDAPTAREAGQVTSLRKAPAPGRATGLRPVSEDGRPAGRAEGSEGLDDTSDLTRPSTPAGPFDPTGPFGLLTDDCERCRDKPARGDSRRIAELEAELAVLRSANEILVSVATYFAKNGSGPAHRAADEH
ncbi:hypothetical protein ACFYWU_30425 [Streptomyces chrestomyceticus]|uniref:hypothetical protein n=1 Tax=Streptomyces chrestomyceticus TaxID=68185 RepID=UPI0036CEFCA1